MSPTTRDDGQCPDTAAGDYSVHDVIVAPLRDDTLDFRRLVGAARFGRDTALAGLRTLARVLRLSLRSERPLDGDIVLEVGALVAHPADYADAMITLESHADYQWQRLRGGAMPPDDPDTLLI